MEKQGELIFKHSLGSFRQMLRDLSRDPAMLIWLDSNQNVKSHPNENYAREVMESCSPRRRQLHGEGHPRGGARLHRLAYDGRDLHVPGRRTRFRSERVPRPDRQLRRRGHPSHPARTAGMCEVHHAQTLSVLRQRESCPSGCVPGPGGRSLPQERLRYRRPSADDAEFQALLLRLCPSSEGALARRICGRRGG